MRFTLGVVGVVLLVAGIVFALQGFSVLGGTAMSGNSFWAAAGPVIAVIGLVLLGAAARRRRQRAPASHS